MRFLHLDFIAYGPFTDVSLDLSEGKQGLHVIYGPNEAGKSVALRAIHGVLFGIPTRTTDNFVHEHNQLRIGARILNCKGETLTFVRRKGNAATILNPDARQGGAFPDDILDPYLLRIDSDTFSRVYGIGYDELTRGGQEMKALRGLAGESLFAAGLGVVGLGKTIETLDEEAKELYTKSRPTSTIRALVNEYKRVLQDKRKAQVPSSRWEELQRAIRKTQAQRDELTEKLKALRTESGGLDRVRRSLPRITEREQLVSELDEMGEVVVLPPSYSSEERRSSQNALQHAGQRVRRLHEELHGESGLLATIKSTSVPPCVLEQADSITALHEDLGSHQKAIIDQSELRVSRDNLRSQAKARLAELKPELPWDEVDSVRLPPDRKVGIQNLGNLERTRRERPAELKQIEASLRAELDADRAELENLDPAQDSGPLKRVLLRVQKDGNVDQQLADAEDAMSAAVTDVELAIDALGLWKGTMNDLERRVVPVRETIERFAGTYEELDRQVDRLDERERQLLEDAADSARKIDALQRAGEVPTEEQLSHARETRQSGWHLVRGDWLDGQSDNEAIQEFAGDKSLADAYEESVGRSDDVADRLRREANRVAQLAQQEASKTHCDKSLSTIDDERKKLEKERGECEAGWCRQWSSTGIDDPLSPSEMRAWLDRFHQLRQLAKGVREARQRVENLRNRIMSHRDELGQCLVALKKAAPTADKPLAALVDRCQEIAERIDDSSRRRTDLEKAIAKCEAALNKAVADRDRAEAELRAWEAKWATNMKLLGCPADATAEEANARIELIDNLFSSKDEADKLDARIEAIVIDAERFKSDVVHLTERVALDLVNLPAAQAVADLTARLSEAKTARVKLDHLEKEETTKQDELEDVDAIVLEMTDKLNALCRLANVDAHDKLGAAEAQSTAVTQRRNRLDAIDRELLELGEGMTIEELMTEAEGQNADDLAARISTINDEIGDLGQCRDEVVGEIRDLENQLNAIDGSAAAAEADEKALGILATLNEAAGRYVRVRLAASVLRYQIEAHRAKTQDPLVSRASDLFAELTCRSFSGLRTEYDDNDRPILVGVRNDGADVVGVEGMSDGTRDQLYLALRLAYVEKLVDCEEPMPFIVDDILVNFDDDRARATLHVLRDLSRRTQVIFFTHHQHLVRIAGSTLSAEDLFVHDLSSSAHPSEPAISHA